MGLNWDQFHTGILKVFLIGRHGAATAKYENISLREAARNIYRIATYRPVEAEIPAGEIQQFLEDVKASYDANGNELRLEIRLET